jgi:hypothetical protein
MSQIRKWAYQEPNWDDPDLKPITVVKTEEQILREYLPYWTRRMEEIGKSHLISPEYCIDDWVVVNWAWEVKDDAI